MDPTPVSSSANTPPPAPPHGQPVVGAFPEAGTYQPMLPASFQVPFSPPLDARVAARLKEIDPTVALVSLRTPNGKMLNHEPLNFFVFNFPQEAAEKLKQGGLIYVAIDGRDGKAPITFGIQAPPPASQANLTPEQQALAELREEIARNRREQDHARALAMFRNPNGAAPVDPAVALKGTLDLLKTLVEVVKPMMPQPVAAAAASPADQIKPLMEGMGAMMTGMAQMTDKARALATPVETEAQKITAYTGAIKELAPVVLPLMKPSAPPVQQPNASVDSPFKNVA